MNTAGLPTIGSVWNFDSDTDFDAFCTPFLRVTPIRSKKPNKYWIVENQFTTRPMKRCFDTEIEDPLLEPDRIGGSFVKYTKEATEDRFGEKLKMSSHEMIRGPQAEFDANRPTVWIEQNVADLDLDTFSDMVDTVNDATLWGVGARKVKLSNVSWERLYKGICDFYYQRRFEFDIDFSTFDRTVVDEGDKVLNGKWVGADWTLVDIADGVPPDKENPNHFMRAIDRAGNPMHVLLDGNGEPLDVADSPTGTATVSSPVGIDIEYYPESNFLELGIPTLL
jgi:hypothetical protein